MKMRMEAEATWSKYMYILTSNCESHFGFVIHESNEVKSFAQVSTAI